MQTLASNESNGGFSAALGALPGGRRSQLAPRPLKRFVWLGTARFRLTAWYVGGLMAILGILGVATYVNLYSELLSDANAKLSIAADEIIGQLQGSPEPQTDQALQSIVIRAPLSIPAAPTTRADAIYIRLIDARTGAIVAESPALRRYARLDRSLPKPRVPAGKPVFGFAGFSEETQMRVMTASVPNSSDLLQTAVSWDSSEDFLTDLTLAICSVCLLLLALSAAGCWLLIGRALAPIDDIVSEAESLSLDRCQAPVIAPRIQTDAEVGHLVGSLNGLLARLHDSISIQRQFSADASHELRTPLTILRGELELSLTRRREEHEYRRVLGSCLEETTRMIRIVQDLSLLARNDNLATQESMQPRFEPGGSQVSETVDVVKVCAEVIRMVKSRATERGISVAVQSETQACPARCREDSFRRAITNLLENAVTYSRKGDAAVVSVLCSPVSVRVEVTDTGIGISESDLPHVFERFYRADKARVNTGGSGLGLSIVKSIAEAEGGSVSITSKLNLGTTVVLILPRAL